jgi:hypothetical protein
MNFNFFFYSLLLIFFFITPSYSYLDPGSSSILLQAIIGFIAAVGATISIYWKKFKNFIKKIFKKDK